MAKVVWEDPPRYVRAKGGPYGPKPLSDDEAELAKALVSRPGSWARVDIKMGTAARIKTGRHPGFAQHGRFDVKTRTSKDGGPRSVWMCAIPATPEKAEPAEPTVADEDVFFDADTDELDGASNPLLTNA